VYAFTRATFVDDFGHVSKEDAVDVFSTNGPPVGRCDGRRVGRGPPADCVLSVRWRWLAAAVAAPAEVWLPAVAACAEEAVEKEKARRSREKEKEEAAVAVAGLGTAAGRVAEAVERPALAAGDALGCCRPSSRSPRAAACGFPRSATGESPCFSRSACRARALAARRSASFACCRARTTLRSCSSTCSFEECSLVMRFASAAVACGCAGEGGGRGTAGDPLRLREMWRCCRGYKFRCRRGGWRPVWGVQCGGGCSVRGGGGGVEW
jgi:hypothetical protein